MLSASAWLNRSHARRLHGADHCRSHPDDPRLVWLFQACLSRDVSRAGWIHPPTTSGDPAPTGQTTGFWTMSRRSETLAQCLLRWTGSFHDDRSPNVSEPIPMRKPLTGEPCAGEPHARFGGRGGLTRPSLPLSTNCGQERPSTSEPLALTKVTPLAGRQLAERDAADAQALDADDVQADEFAHALNLLRPRLVQDEAQRAFMLPGDFGALELDVVERQPEIQFLQVGRRQLAFDGDEVFLFPASCRRRRCVARRCLPA